MLDAVTFQNFAVVKGGIYFIPGPDADGRYWVRFLNLATGNTTPVLTLSGPRSEGLAVSPDARTILCTQVDQRGSDLMLVENFQ